MRFFPNPSSHNPLLHQFARVPISYHFVCLGWYGQNWSLHYQPHGLLPKGQDNQHLRVRNIVLAHGIAVAIQAGAQHPTNARRTLLQGRLDPCLGPVWNTLKGNQSQGAFLLLSTRARDPNTNYFGYGVGVPGHSLQVIFPRGGIGFKATANLFRPHWRSLGVLGSHSHCCFSPSQIN